MPEPIPFELVERALRRPAANDDPVMATAARLRRQDIEDTLQRSGSPEQTARTTRVARETGLAPALVEGREDEIEAAQRARTFGALAERYPAIGRFAARNPRAAVAAQDDTESLGLLGNAWDFIRNVPQRAGVAGGWSVGGMLADTFGGIEELNDAAMAPLWSAMSALSRASGIEALDPEPVLEARARERDRTSAAFRGAAERAREAARGTSPITEGLLAGTESIPLTIGAVLTRNPTAAATIFGVASGGASYAEGRRAGLDIPTSLRYGATQGGIEAVTERVPAGTLVDLITRKTPWGRAFVRELGQEMTGEQAATFLQDLTAWAYLPENRNKTLRQFAAERPQAAVDTALAVAGGTTVTTAGIGAAQRAAEAAVRVTDRIGEVRRARLERRFFDTVERATQGSKLKGRDAEAFRDLIRQQAEEAGASSVYIPGEAVRAYSQSDTYDRQDDPFAQYDVEEAAAAGGDIIVPIEDFIANVVGTPAWQAVKDDVRLTGGGMSTREADEAQADLDNIMERLSDEFAERDRAEVAEKSVREKLVDAIGTMFGVSFTSPTARSYGEVQAQRMMVRAARTGSPLTKADLAGLEVRQDMGEVSAGAQVYEQARSMERETPVTRNSEAPLDVLRIDSASATFDEAKAAFGDRVKAAVATMRSGEQVAFTQARKALFSKSDRFEQGLRYAAIPHLPEIVGNAVSYATTGKTGEFIHAAAQIDLGGRPVSVRLVLKDVGDEALRQYQIEGFEVTAAPEDMLRSEELGTMAPEAAAARSVSEVVEDFKGRQLFQSVMSDTPRGRIIFDQNRRIIELFQSRNLSTPLHELSHMWLEELRFDAESNEQLAADWATVKTWFAQNGHPVGPDGQIPTEAHELWARTGERYFMEGKAPTSALVRLFEQFRGWLVGIYKTVDKLRAPITPEIREVFDRLLATDEEIAAARDRQHLKQLFDDAGIAQQFGMTADEFTAYQRQVDDARAGAHASLLDKTMKAIRQRETERYRDSRKAVRAEEQERIDGSPLYKALAGMKEQRVSKEWIVDNLGAEALDLLPVRVPPLYVSGGADPNIVAELSGYAGAQDMLEAVIAAERQHRALKEGGDERSMRVRAIETATDEEMNRRWGDPLNDGSIEREALAAVHSEMQGEVIASELRVLARKTGRRPAPYQLAREWARGKVRAGTVAEEASPGAIQRYARNAAKAGREAEAAMLKGDADETFRQKQFQMLNNALLVSAKEAHDEVQAAVRRMDKIARAKTRKSVDQDYLEQAQALLEAVDLKKRTEKSLALKDQFMAWAQARKAEGFDIVVPDNYEGALQTNWTRMAVGDLLTLDEAVKQIIHLGRLAQSFADDEERRDREEVVAEAVDGMGGMRQKPPTDLMEPSFWDTVKSKVASIDAALLKMETVFDWLDRGNSNGVFNRIVFRPLAVAQELARLRMNDMLGQLNEAMEAVPAKTLRRWNERVRTELLNGETGRPWVFKRAHLVSMALNMGNRGNIDKLAGGYGWNEAAIREVLSRELTAEEWAYVQSVWDIIDSLWPDIEAMEKRLNGVAPEKVEAVPVDTPFGQLRGGYFPVVYDPTKNYDAEANAAKGRDLFETIYTRATTPRGFTKERTEVQRPIHLSLNIISRHIAEVIHDVTHREAVMQADRFLGDRRVMKAIDDTLGPEIRKAFRPWLQRIANQWAYDRAGMAGIEGFLNKMRLNATVVGMGFRVSTMLVQLAGYSNSFEVVGERWVAPRLKDAANPAAWKFVLEKSQEVAGRMASLDRDIADAAKRAAGGKKLSAPTRFVFHGIGYMDRVVVIPTWLGAYDKALAQGMEEKDAVYAADKAVRTSQGAGAAKDMAAIQAGHGKAGALGKYLTMFYSFMSAFYQRQRTLARDVRSAGPKDVPRLMARAWWLLVVSPLLAELLAGRGPGDDDDDETWASWATQAVAGQFFGPLPIARDVVPVLARKFKDQSTFGYRFTPAQGGIEAFMRLADNAERAWEGEETRDATRNVIELTGYSTGHGLATGQVAAATQFLVDVGYGDADPEGIGDWWEGLTRGRVAAD